ncbi:MAG: glycoside hydrolase family 88 protein, partial [Anaerolineaceae bacterium]|nr:glycoside hydrolase family 88 protein [Anaerolineaceae bacterium]
MSGLAEALAASILYRYPDPDEIPYRPWCYVQGYILLGLEKLWLATGETRYFEYIKRFVDQHVRPDGNLIGFTGESLDDMMAGTVIVAMYEHTGELRYQHAARLIREALFDYPRNSDGGFWHNRGLPHEMWIDGVFMGQMFLTRYGAVIGEKEVCFAEAIRQIETLARHCRKGNSGLFLHAYDEARRSFWADPETGLSPEVWSEGLGWYALILVETLALMPKDFPERAIVEKILVDLVEGLRKTQDKNTGLWYQVVDKGSLVDNWQDTSGSAMFVYAIQRAIELGYASSEIYLPVTQKGYA